LLHFPSIFETPRAGIGGNEFDKLQGKLRLPRKSARRKG
jgi:hypothetical protein